MMEKDRPNPQETAGTEREPAEEMNMNPDEENMGMESEEKPGNELEMQLAQKNAEVEELKERILRLHADFDNYRKRTNKEKEEWFQYASQGVVINLLPVLDNLERALGSMEQQVEDKQGLMAGVNMIYRQLMDVLQREGLQPIEALGRLFDPLLHEAIMQVPVEEGQEDNLIVEELRKGYRFKDKVIRPTMVKVAKNM
ncbi:nucleotide exchange factor GrpE [Thermanaerosceptrum fracticalcis]|uniref:Protein GrpE n=2 Tax=Thermanaerosceptrum fracticalcis TaxID=1712410 RepID=A0A7G6E257_THEFR|nr:nucleotide exchange factor GrpE [Thermanaerosceptrum fracticalcis]